MKYRRVLAPKDNDCFFHVVAHAVGYGELSDKPASRRVRLELARHLARTLFEDPHGDLDELVAAVERGEASAVRIKRSVEAEWYVSAIGRLGLANGGDLDPTRFVAWMHFTSEQIESLRGKGIKSFSFWGDLEVAAALVGSVYDRPAHFHLKGDIGNENPPPAAVGPRGAGTPIRFLYEQNHYDAFLPDASDAPRDTATNTNDPPPPPRDDRSPTEGSPSSNARDERRDPPPVLPSSNNGLPDSASQFPPRSNESSSDGVTLPCEASLVLTHVTPHFAPGASGEFVHFDYKITGLADQPVTLTVTSSGRLLSRYRLSSSERANGARRVSWDGRLDERAYITAAQSPFTVTLASEDGQHTSSMVFRVLCHSIELTLGAWSRARDWAGQFEPPKSGHEFDDWLCHRLNQLGYYAGPVDEPSVTHRAKALTRYRANHPTLQRWHYEDYDTPLGSEERDELLRSLREGEGARRFLSRPAPDDDHRAQLAPGDPLALGGTGKLRIHVEAPFFAARKEIQSPPDIQATEEMEAQYLDGQTKTQLEAQRLNRPVLPIEATVYLLGSDGRPRLSPAAVGDLAIEWTYEEPQEDLSAQLADNLATCSFQRSYIRTALELEGGRRGERENNCLEAYGGIRRPGAPNANRAFVRGRGYHPYETTAASDAAPAVTRVFQDVNDSQLRECLGRAVVLFQPSFIAGDAYVIRAAIRAGDLVEPDRAPPPARTSTMEVWRDARVAAVVGWPARGMPQSDFEKMRAEYRRAFLDLDVSDIARVSITDVLRDEEYAEWFQRSIELVGLKGLTPASTLSPDVMFRFVRDDEADLGMAETMESLSTLQLLSELPLAMLAPLIARNLRRRLPVGAVFIDGLPYRVTTEEARMGGAVADVSCGLANGFVFMNHAAPEALAYVLTHELGHCFWLMHGRGTSKSELLIADHDLSDRNCMMVYSSENKVVLKLDPQRDPHTRDAHFCGKCNLKLRGWDVSRQTAPRMPLHPPRIELRWTRDALIPTRGGQIFPSNEADLELRMIGVPPGVQQGATELSFDVFDTLSRQIERRTVPTSGVVMRDGAYVLVAEFSTTDERSLLAGARDYQLFARARLDWEADPPKGKLETPITLLPVRPRLVLCGDLRDPGLQTLAEFDAVESALGDTVRPDRLTFNGNPDLFAWTAALAPCHVYHHVSHGNLQCDVHKTRAYMPESASDSPTPRYPWFCQHDKRRVGELLAFKDDILVDDKGFARHDSPADIRWMPLMKQFLQPNDRDHPMRGAFQWCMDDDSANDVLFTTDHVRDAFTELPESAPRWLAFLNCCVVGWHAAMPQAFIDAGTRYVIAWRCAVSGAGVGMGMARDFYAAWARLGVVPDNIPKAFKEVAFKYAGTEPVLFSKSEVFHVFEAWDSASNRKLPAFASHKWSKLRDFYQLRLAEPVEKKKGLFW